MAKNTRRVGEAQDQPEQQPSTAEKLALYTLIGTLGQGLLTAVTQIVVAWLQRH